MLMEEKLLIVNKGKKNNRKKEERLLCNFSFLYNYSKGTLPKAKLPLTSHYPLDLINSLLSSILSLQVG